MCKNTLYEDGAWWIRATVSSKLLEPHYVQIKRLQRMTKKTLVLLFSFNGNFCPITHMLYTPLHSRHTSN